MAIYVSKAPLAYPIIQKVTDEHFKWLDYCEKDYQKYLGTYDNPEDYQQHAGDGNMTVFAKLYKEKTGIDVQGQPWCDSYQDTVLIHLFGVDKAKQLLGGFSAYTPTSANFFKQMGRWFKDPNVGVQVFFKNSTRIYHVGYVYDWDEKYIYTIEGNTSSAPGVIANGGCVAKKKYLRTDPKIAGYGFPDYSIVNEFKEGWVRAADGVRWWYQTREGKYPANVWCIINHHWYLFDKEGYMLTNWHTWDGKNCDVPGDENWYFLETSTKHNLEGAMYGQRPDSAVGLLSPLYVSDSNLIPVP